MGEVTVKKGIAYRMFKPLHRFFLLVERALLKLARFILFIPRKIASKLNRKVLYILIAVLVLLLIGAYMFAWLGLKVTSPTLVLYSIVHLNFDIYAGMILLLIVFLFINNLFQIVIGIYDNRFNKKRFVIINVVLVLLIVGIFLLSYVFRHPVLEYNYPKYGESLQDYTTPVEVVFNLPVRVSELEPNIVPELVGKWVWEPYLGMSGISRVGHYYPEVTAFPGDRFVLYISGISKLTDGNQHEYGFAFEAPALPNIFSTYPENNATNISRDDVVVLQLDKDSRDMVDWTFTITPKVEFDIEYTEENEIKLDPKELLSQGESYTIGISYRPKRINILTNEVFNQGEVIVLDNLVFETSKEPLVNTFFPTGTSAKPTDRIKIEFSEEMNRESVEENFILEPEIEGEFEWENDKNLTYTHLEDLQKDTKYKVTLVAGMKSTYNGVIETEAVYEFKTVGKVSLLGTDPAHDQSNVSEFTDIRVTFDQEVDKGSVIERFSISPALSGNVSWEGNTLVYDTTQALNFEAWYTVSVAAGVKSVYGLDSDAAYSFNFRVRSNVYVFSIPLFYQPAGSFSCNIYTAMMVLAHKGHQSSANGLIAEIGYDANRAGDSWTGNPYTEYVGNADGSWGYGVYYGPIQQIFANRGIGSEAKVGWNVSELAQQVQQGRPVVFWRYNGVSSGNDISWTSDDGTYVHAFSGMHGGVVTGFMGSASNPTHLYVNDPWFGQFWMDVGSFNYYWSFTNNMALIVY